VRNASGRWGRGLQQKKILKFADAYEEANKGFDRGYTYGSSEVAWKVRLYFCEGLKLE
jgi:hypothetical protein